MSAWANQPYPDLNYDYNLPKEIKQIDRRIVKMLNEYFGILKVSCGTINVNTLHKMCLLKLLRDVIDSDGPLYVFMQQSEAKDWTDYIKRCFNELVYKDGAMDIDPEENVCPPAPEPTPPGPDEPVLRRIEVDPEKTIFFYGDTFVGGTVTAYYSNGTSEDVTENSTFTGYNMSAVGSQTVTVTYQGKTDDYNITVRRKLVSIVATPDHDECNVGDTYTYTGTIRANYNDGTYDSNVRGKTGYSITSVNTSSAGTNKPATITYTENGVSAQYTITVTVNSVQPVVTTKWYTGVSSSVPSTASDITGADLKTEALITTTSLLTPHISRTYIWIAIPNSMRIVSITNKAFNDTEVYLSNFAHDRYVSIDGTGYTIYYAGFSVPPAATYYQVNIQ